ncbi:ABC transporter ATP-binding protein [Pseudoalteromonas sp. ZZD1]|uniref:ABC transporter ATP-binding protein n=1 Tax=Pseudoalteromonas sp. ZZD1 TaxID=3139395 RepID=UPI003BACB65A
MLTLTNINKRYADGTHALNDVSIHLPAGMVGLLGPNGAGKSSLMRTLACLQSVDNGQINFDGLDVLQHPEQMRKQLGYLPQQFGVYPNMSCFALLEHIAILKGLNKKDRKQQIDELLALLNLSQFANKKVSHFSGGMKQRFGIAQALLGSPKLIILDEPTAGLDPAERESLNNLLVTISKQRLVLLSTHIVEDIENQCHFVAMINQGRLIKSGEVAALIKPLHGCVWLLDTLPIELPQESFVLSKSYRYGKPSFRVYATTTPAESAIPAEPTLQDSYFYELKARGCHTCY